MGWLDVEGVNGENMKIGSDVGVAQRQVGQQKSEFKEGIK
jgi:hypothetical protein